jgi:predicted nucleic acid-binding protein
MIYIDTSSFLKLFLVEPESSDVESVVARISCVVVSQLAYLEATVQVRGMIEGGSLTRKVGKSVMRDMPDLIQNQPFVFHKLAGTVFDTALTQQTSAKTHCRSLDRLHLAAMEELGITRLMTHDTRQAAAVLELGYEVISPGLG